jgi:iron complex outermembrane recepter protein
MKVSVIRPALRQTAFIAVIGVSLCTAPKLPAQTIVRAALASPPPAQMPTGAIAEVERVIVTGSNIPTAEETGPNPVDTYRPADLEKLGIRNATDLTTFLPQQSGATVNLNIGNGGDGTVQFNLRGLLAKETLVLVDGKRVALGSLNAVGFSGGVDINLLPFPMIDHIDILKDGASAVYGSDAIAGVVNFFLIHKFRGLEIGGSYGNTNLGASNDMGEWEAWIKAGTGDDKTEIVVIADFWERTGGMFSRDRHLSANAFYIPWGGFDNRSGFVSRVRGRLLLPSIFFGPGGTPLPGVNTPPPHSAPNVATSPFYKRPYFPFFNLPPPLGPGIPPGTPGTINPNAYPGAPGVVGPHARQFLPQFGTKYRGGGDYFSYNFAAGTPALPPADRQAFYGSFTRDLSDKYLTVFADFKYVRSFFDASLAAVPFTVDPFKKPGTNIGFSPLGFSVPIQNPFNPFTVGDTTLVINGTPIPMTNGVAFRGINDTGPRHEKFTYWDQLFDLGLRGEMGEFGDYFKTWNWELGFRYSRNEGQNLSVGEASQPGLREALLDTDPATAFDPFLNFNAHNTKAARQRVYVTLHNSGEYELPIGYVTVNGDLFNLPAGPVSFAIGGEYDAPRWTRDRDSLNTTFQSIGSTDGGSARVNRDVWSIYQEVRVPFTSPTWNFPGFYSFEIDFAEREEWYSQNTSAVLASSAFPSQPATHSQYNTQKPKVSVRWQPLDPKYIGALTLRGSYTEAFHAPALSEISPASTQSFGSGFDRLTQDFYFTEIRVIGNPNLQPEVAYEWSYGAVYSPKWIKGLTLSADWWHIDMRSIASLLGFQFIVENNIPGLVIRDPSTIPGRLGPIILVIDPNENLTGAIFEGLDYEAIYILDSSIFGHGDFGRLTATLNGTWLSRAELQILPDTKRFGIAGEVIPPGFTLTGSLPWNRANFSLFYDAPADTWMQGLDIGAVVHYTGQYEDDNLSLTQDFFTAEFAKPQTPRSGPLPWRARKVREWITLDLIASYTFNLPPPATAEVPGLAKDGGKNVKVKDGKEKNVMPVSTAKYNPCGWRAWLNNTTITLGMQNVFDEDPPFVAGAFENGYDESLATIKGRFWYVQLKKRF